MTRFLLLLLTIVLVAGGCSSAQKKQVEDPVPKGFELPAGVTLTDGGTVLTKGKPATAIYQIADKTRSAVTVSVVSITKGNIGDFRFFSLDAAAKASTPYYVVASMQNLGPAGLGGAPVPLYAHDSTNTIAPPNQLVGDFAPCPRGTLPKSFLPNATAKVCLVYLLPKGSSLVSIDLQTADLKDPITWKP